MSAFLPVLLTFGWFPLFFVFMALFVARCRRDYSKPAREEPTGRKLVWFSTSARVFIHLACLVPTVLACVSPGLYFLLSHGAVTASMLFFAAAVLLVVLGLWVARYFLAEASFNEHELCSQSAFSRSPCVAWEDVSVIRFDSNACCYLVFGSRDKSSVLLKLRVSIFASGILDFESTAQRVLGESCVAGALQAADRVRSKQPRGVRA